MGETAREVHQRRFPWHTLTDYQGDDGITYQRCLSPCCEFDTAKDGA